MIAYSEEFDDSREAQVSDKRDREQLENILNVAIWGLNLMNKTLPHFAWLPSVRHIPCCRCLGFV